MNKTMKKCILFLPFLCTALPSLFARDYKSGIFITDLYNFDHVQKSFSADFWTWAVYDGEETNFEGTINPVGDLGFTSEIYTVDRIRDENGGEHYWMQQKILSEFHCDWDLKKFPFDVNVLAVAIEDYRSRDEIRFIPDTADSGISDTIFIDGCEISDFKISEIPIRYNSDFGSPAPSASVYSQLCAEITVRRTNPWITFFKLTACVYISLLISVLSFFMKPNTDSRISLPSAALFAVVSNKYVVEATVPSTSALTLLDSIHTLSMVAILAIFLVIIKTDGMRATEEKTLLEKSIKIDRLAAILISVLYVTFNIVMM